MTFGNFIVAGDQDKSSKFNERKLSSQLGSIHKCLVAEQKKLPDGEYNLFTSPQVENPKQHNFETTEGDDEHNNNEAFFASVKRSESIKSGSSSTSSEQSSSFKSESFESSSSQEEKKQAPRNRLRDQSMKQPKNLHPDLLMGNHPLQHSLT